MQNHNYSIIRNFFPQKSEYLDGNLNRHRTRCFLHPIWERTKGWKERGKMDCRVCRPATSEREQECTKKQENLMGSTKRISAKYEACLRNDYGLGYISKSKELCPEAKHAIEEACRAADCRYEPEGKDRVRMLSQPHLQSSRIAFVRLADSALRSILERAVCKRKDNAFGSSTLLCILWSDARRFCQLVAFFRSKFCFVWFEMARFVVSLFQVFSFSNPSLSFLARLPFAVCFVWFLKVDIV